MNCALYFIVFYTVSCMVLLNLLTAMLLDVFALQTDEVPGEQTLEEVWTPSFPCMHPQLNSPAFVCPPPTTFAPHCICPRCYRCWRSTA